jgi:hypothetical protein
MVDCPMVIVGLGKTVHIPSHLVVPLCIPADCLDLSVRCLHRNTSAYEA